MLILALVLTLSFVTAFSACNKKTPPAPDTSREDARDEFVSIVMFARDSAWLPDLIDEEIAFFDNAGDYIVALKWTTFVSDVLYDSGLQTGKIKKINSVLASDKGKQMIADIENRQFDYLPVLKEIGLTDEDVEEIVLDGIVGIFEKSESILNDCISRAENVKLISQNGTARDNLDNVISSSERSKDALLSTSTEELKQVVLGVEDGIKNIVGFAYDTALLFANEGDSNLIKTLTSGALDDANASELALYLESAFDSVSALKSQLTDENVKEIGNALGLIIDKMEGVTVTSEVFSSIVNVLKYVYTFIDFLPYACEYVGIIGEYLTAENDEYCNLQSLLNAYTNDEYIIKTYDEFGNVNGETRVNLAVPFAKMALAVLGVDYTSEDSLSATKVSAKQKVDDLLTKIVAGAKNDYKKSIVLLYIDVLFQGDNASFVKLSADDEEMLANIIVNDMTVGSFRNAYAKNSRDKTERKGLVNAISVFNRYLDASMSVPSEVTYEWFKSVLDSVREKLTADVASMLDKVSVNLSTNVDSVFDTYIDRVVDIAKMSVAKVGTAEYDALVEKIEKLAE